MSLRRLVLMGRRLAAWIQKRGFKMHVEVVVEHKCTCIKASMNNVSDIYLATDLGGDQRRWSPSPPQSSPCPASAL